MAELINLAGTASHSFSIGQDGVTTYYGTYVPPMELGRIGDTFIQTKIELEDEHGEQTGETEDFGRVYHKMMVDDVPTWVILKNYTFDSPIINENETEEDTNNYRISLQNAKGTYIDEDEQTHTPDSTTSQGSDYGTNHDFFGVTRYATNTEAVADDIANYQTWSSTSLPTNFDKNTNSHKFEDKFVSMTPEQIGKNIKVEMKRAISVEGTLNSLTTRTKANLVSAINEHDNEIGTVTTAMATGSALAGKTIATGNNTDIAVAPALSSLNTAVKTNKDNIGTLSNLTTDAKTNLVAAINEVDSHADTNTSNIGTLSNLTTDAKTNLVSAINEVDSHADTNTSNIGTMTSLTTRTKTTLVGAINELDGDIGTVTTAMATGSALAGKTISTGNNTDITVANAISTLNTAVKTNKDNIAQEIIDRAAGDTALQDQIDAIIAKSDVVDVVGTYQDLLNYNTSTLGDNDIIKVLVDSTHDGDVSYYRWKKATSTWEYIGSVSEYYTRAQADERFVHLTTDETIAGTKTFSTTPVVGTLAESNNSTSAASTAYVTRAIATEDGKVVHTTGNETVAGTKTFSNGITLGNSASFNGTAGSVTVATQAQSDNSTNAASTAYVRSAISTEDALVVHLSGNETIAGTKTFSTTPVVGTLAENNNSTSAASTAYVTRAIATEDSKVVHITGDETVAGTKTFTSRPSISRAFETNSRDERLKNVWTNIKLANDEALPSNTVYAGFSSLDANNFEYSTVYSSILSNGTTQTALWVNHPNGSSSEIGIKQTAAGVVSTFAPTPTATNSTSDTNIATTGWVNDSSKSTNVVHRTGDETITGTKTMTSATVHVATQARGNSTTLAASTAFVADGLSLKVDKSSLPSITSGTNGQVLSNNGSAFVWKTVRDITTLGGLDDTAVDNEQDDQSLVFDSTIGEEGAWVNKRPMIATISYW